MQKGKFARLLRGKDPEELAKAIVVHRKTVERWLEGTSLPHPGLLPVIAVATQIPFYQLQIAYRADKGRRRQAAP